MNNIFKIARYEFKMTVSGKAFIILTILGPFLILALTVLPTLLNQNSGVGEETVIALVGGDENILGPLEQGLMGAELSVEISRDEQYVRQSILDGKISGYLKIPENYLEEDVFKYESKTGTDVYVSGVINGVLNNTIMRMKLENSGLTEEQMASLSRYPSFRTSKISEDGTVDDSTSNSDALMEIMFTCIGFTLLIYMTIILYGQSIGRSVLLEKLSKTVDIMLSSVRPLDILWGKIIGIGLASILQYSIWMIMAFLTARGLGPALNLSIPSTINLTNFAFLILFFILSYFLYSSIYAALGSGADDEQHFGQLAMIPLIFLILPMVATSVIVFNPESSISRFFSFFPFTSPLVMLIRVIVSIPPLSEFLISIGILAVTIPIITFLGAKIFRIGILMTGKRYTLKEIVRWITIR